MLLYYMNLWDCHNNFQCLINHEVVDLPININCHLISADVIIMDQGLTNGEIGQHKEKRKVVSEMK